MKKTKGLTPEETAELDKFMQLEHLIRLAKAPGPAPYGCVSGTYISAALRQQVLLRAGDRCEYCGISGLMTFGFHIDHIISEKHGGPHYRRKSGLFL